MAKLAPVRPAVLSWAMREAGLSLEDLAERSGVGADRISAFLAADEGAHASPRAGEFRDLAKALNRSTAALLLPEPPPTRPREASFRTPPGRAKDRALLPAEQSALRETARWQLIVGNLREKEGMPRPDLPISASGESASAAATKISNWIGWDLDRQKQESSPAAVLRLARGAFEARGVLTLQFSLSDGACKGFSIPDARAPAIALNSSYNAAARLFSVFHEAAHLARGDRAVCGAVRDDRVERWCESVAARLLLPELDVRAYVMRRFGDEEITAVAVCQSVATHYNVSLRATAVRLKELGLASDVLWGVVDALPEGNVSIPNPNVPRQTTPVIRQRELGAAIPGLLLSMMDRETLTEFQVRRLLDVNGPQLRELRMLLQSGEGP